jgi:uncharacterized protein (TIGR03546 family)
MFTLKKIWNILNHAGKPWQVSLAVSLAMIAGFTPFLSVHNVLIFFLVFVLNVHFGMFLLATAFFSGIGYLFDPLFHSLGLSILTNESLHSLWTSFYNNPFIKITSFNNSIVMGSLVVSLVLFFPVLKATSYFLVKYREQIASRVKNIPILNKIGFFNEEEKSEVRPIRVLGFGIFFGFIGLLVVAKSLYFDSFIKSLIEQNITNNTDKIVQIKSIDSSIILNSNLEINGLSITDKQNSQDNVAIDTIVFDFEFSKLLLKKIIVENISLTNIHFPNEVKIKPTPKQNTSTPSSESSDSSISKEDLVEITNLNKLDVSDVEKALNGDLKAKIAEYKEYYEKIKPLFNNTKKDEATIVHTRDNGSWVKFRDTTGLPDVVFKNGSFTISYADEHYNGKIKDFSTNQTIYNKPFILSIGGTTKKITNLNMKLTTFKTDKKDEDTFSVKCDSYKVSDQIQDKVSFTNTKVNVDVDIAILNSSALSGKGIFKVLNTDIDIKSSNKYINRLNKQLKNTSGINAKTNIKGNLDNPKVTLSTNVDEVLKAKIKTFVNSQKKELQNELKNKAKDRVKKEIEKKVGSKVSEKIGSGVSEKLGDILKF